MKLKYYLRGLGTGILFATIILFISYSYKMSDSQIKKKAEELGMVYAGTSEQTTDLGELDSASGSTTNRGESTTASSTSKSEDTSEKGSSTETTTNQENVTSQSTNEEPTTPEQPIETTTPEEVTTPEAATQESTTANQNVEKCELTVTGATSSNDVAYALANAGIIDDAEAFNDFLCNGGYDRKIQNGTYTITSDMSYEDIAKLITTRKY